MLDIRKIILVVALAVVPCAASAQVAMMSPWVHMVAPVVSAGAVAQPVKPLIFMPLPVVVTAAGGPPPPLESVHMHAHPHHQDCHQVPVYRDSGFEWGRVQWETRCE